MQFQRGEREEWTEQDLESGLFDELDARVELTEFVVAPTGVGEYFYAVEAHEDVRAVIYKGRVEGSLTHTGVQFFHLDGVKSSSQSSTPMHVSIVLTTQSPNGTLT